MLKSILVLTLTPVLIFCASPARAEEPTQFSKVQAADRANLDAKVFNGMLAKKPIEVRRNGRLNAFYEALCVLMADSRYHLFSIVVEVRGKNRDVIWEPSIVLDGNLSPISFGKVILTNDKQEKLTLTFDAGHIQEGVDLDKIEGWLYAVGNVGSHRGFYSQLEASDWGRRP